MPNDKPGEPVERKPIEQSAGGNLTNPPPPPNDPTPAPTQGISRQEVQAEVQGIEDRVRRAELWMIGLTAAIAFSGFCAVGVGIMQWREIHAGSTDTHDLAVAAGKQADRMKDFADRLKDQADQTKTIADQAIIQANAAKDSVDTTKRQMRLDQRAWLGIVLFDIMPPDPSGIIRMRIEIVNTGKTPAISVSQGYTTIVWPKPLLIKPPPDAAQHIVLKPLAPIPPQGKSSLNVEVNISGLGSHYAGIKSGTEILYGIGEIHYRDIFGGHHVTKFFEYQKVPEAQLMSTCQGGNFMN
jgi:hypothetical protein